VLLRYPEPVVAARDVLPIGADLTRRKVVVSDAPAASDTIRVALVGAGNIARWAHLPALKKVGGVALHAVHSASGVRGKSYARRFGAAYCATSFDVILEDPAIDAVIITSRNQQHAPQAIAALRAGKHVFVEKPMALTELECRQVQEAVEETGRTLSVGFNRRFAPDYLAVKRQLARRGGPAVLNCRVNSPGIAGSYWMADPEIGGAILGEACHFVDLMYWLLDTEPLEVSAYSLPTGREEPIGENNIAATFRFADGSIATLTYCTVGSATSGGEQLEAFAPGIGVVTSDFKRLVIRGRTERVSRRFFPEKGYDAQLAEFFAAIRERRDPQVTVRDGVRSTVGCLRMLESARDGQPRAFDMPPVVV
jgi:predicted dehydrogenase